MSKLRSVDRRGFLETLARSAAGGAVLGLSGALTRAQNLPSAPRNLRVGLESRSVLSPSDFTCLGAFTLAPSGDPNFAGALALRMVAGQPRLYSFPRAGGSYGLVSEFLVPPDGALKTAAPFPSATLTHFLGDIYQNALYSSVGKGYGAPPFEGLAGGLCPNSLYWDESDQRMYWTYCSAYNTTFGVADTVVGYSTLNDTTKTGKGVGMWRLCPPAEEGGDNSRWVNGLVPIPPGFASAFLGGRRLGVGFGGSLSIVSNGPVSVGPALFAVDPAGFTPGTNRNYPAIAPTKLMLHKFGTAAAAGFHRPPRDPALQCYNDYTDEGEFRGQTNVWNWSDPPPAAVWIDTGTKHGFIVFALLSGGNVRTTVVATPSPTRSGFRVASPAGLHVGDFIRVNTDHNPNPGYPFEMVGITGISGSDITHSGTTGTPLVPGSVFAGVWYAGGGCCASNWWTPWYIYNPADLAAVAQGRQQADRLVPVSMTNYPLPHVGSYPLPGGGPNQARPCHPKAAVYDAAAKRLYVLFAEAYLGSLNDGRPLVYVFALDD